MIMCVKQLQSIIVILMTLLVSTSPLFAQASSVDKAPEQGRLLSMFLAFILATAIIVASIWGSRRGHQD
ncbi:MAG TPA: hypothetical protein DCM28_20635 [Phycisphaerales bacterium]|nr:hypothetical protein [Phycisphaerales bacterium]|tara:strand:- start:2010 stop:2216 length:207 start_codon:yes stop_codon:yes gene_type:complete